MERRETILVAGADGQLGQALRTVSGAWPAWRFVFVNRAQADICCGPAWREMARNHDATGIINCAAWTAVDRAENEPEAADRVNRLGAAVLADVAVREGVWLVHVSTDYVFGGDGLSPCREEDPTAPLGVYGATKLAGEEEIRRRKPDAAIVRTAWLYSEYGHNFLKTMLQRGAAGVPLRVVDDQWGRPTCATDLARALLTLVARGIRGVETWHYTGGGRPTTWYGFAAEIFRQADIAADLTPVTTADYPTPARRPAWSVLDTARIERAGVPVPDWHAALRACLRRMGYPVREERDEL